MVIKVSLTGGVGFNVEKSHLFYAKFSCLIQKRY